MISSDDNDLITYNFEIDSSELHIISSYLHKHNKDSKEIAIQQKHRKNWGVDRQIKQKVLLVLYFTIQDAIHQIQFQAKSRKIEPDSLVKSLKC